MKETRAAIGAEVDAQTAGGSVDSLYLVGHFDRLQVQHMTHGKFTPLLGAENDAQLAGWGIAEVDLEAQQTGLVFDGLCLGWHFYLL